jgi:phosphomannomutase
MNTTKTRMTVLVRALLGDWSHSKVDISVDWEAEMHMLQPTAAAALGDRGVELAFLEPLPTPRASTSSRLA